MNEKLQAIVDAFNSGILGEGDLLPLMGQIEARRKQARYDALDKAAAAGIDVDSLLKEHSK